MALPKEKSSKVTSLSEQIIMIYGRPKIGKSTLCSCFPNAIFLATEPGLKGLDVFKVNCTKWTEFLTACKEIKEGQHEFKTVIIDTVDKMLDLIQRHVCEEEKVDSIGDIPHGRGYTASRNILSQTLDKLAGLPYGLVLVSHCQTMKIETATGTRV